MSVAAQIAAYKMYLLCKTDNERKGTTMYHDSTRYPEKGDWTKLADATDITIRVKAPTFLYRIEKVIFNPPATVVIWSDGEKTVVKTSKDDVFSKETGLAMAIAKRYFGSRSKFLEAVGNAEGEVPEDKAPKTPTPIEKAEVVYLCDGKACEQPMWCLSTVGSRPEISCSHTADIHHAVNFELVGPNLWAEKGRTNEAERTATVSDE